MTSRGFNAGRALAGGAGKNNVTQQTRDYLRGGSPPILQRAVVVDVIFDPTSLTDDQQTSLENNTLNPELVEGMPFNSILGRIVTDSQDLTQSGLHIFYPMFPSHFQMPVKPGEQVLIMYEDYSRSGNSVGYWLTRPMSARQVEDLNYTHYDRIYDPLNHPRNMDSRTLSNLSASAPTFPNGAGTPETYSLQPSGSTNPFEDIVTNSTSSLLVTFEEVPRFKKRPGDFVLFGSNNTGLILGTDRTGPVIPVTGSNGVDILEKAGTIDLVAGLGAPRKIPGDENTDPTEDNHNPTSPRVIQNSRGSKEVYKTPYKSQKVDNPKEGDPDFQRDLSRVYISMKTKGDKNFGINLGGDNGIFPKSENKLTAKIEDLPVDEQNGQPFIIAKSEQIRLIATKKDNDNGPSENGEIRFIKEGTVDNDKDLSLFVMAKDGRIVMVGKEVQFQTHDNGKILLKCKNSTDDSDPMVLYSKFKEFAEEVFNKMEDLRDQIGDQIGSLGSQGIPAPNAAGPFSPIPGLIQLKLQTATVQQNIKSIVVDFKSKIEPCRSKWLFINKDSQND